MVDKQKCRHEDRAGDSCPGTQKIADELRPRPGSRGGYANRNGELKLTEPRQDYVKAWVCDVDPSHIDVA